MKPHAARVTPARRAITVAANTETTLDEPCQAFHAQASGNVVCTLAGDSAAATFVVVQGATYPYAAKSFAANNPTQVIALFN